MPIEPNRRLEVLIRGSTMLFRFAILLADQNIEPEPTGRCLIAIERDRRFESSSLQRRATASGRISPFLRLRAAFPGAIHRRRFRCFQSALCRAAGRLGDFPRRGQPGCPLERLPGNRPANRAVVLRLQLYGTERKPHRAQLCRRRKRRSARGRPQLCSSKRACSVRA